VWNNVTQPSAVKKTLQELISQKTEKPSQKQFDRVSNKMSITIEHVIFISQNKTNKILI